MRKNFEVMGGGDGYAIFAHDRGPCLMMHEPRLAEGVFIKLGC